MMTTPWVVLVLQLAGTAAPVKWVPCPDAPGTPCQVVNGRYVKAFPEPTPPKPVLPVMSCIEDDTNKVCGFNCLKNYGQMRCAMTPQGRCASVEGKVACWDPPAAYLAYLGTNAEAASCLANYGEVACGYNCVEHNGHVACSETPMGRCAGNFGKITCFDPPLSLLPLFQGAVPQAQCMEAFEKIACGYHCVGQFGQVKCSTTPQGTCTTKGGNVLCFDPPTSELVFMASQPNPGLAESSCLEERGRVACGYRCLANEGDVACAVTPRGSCNISDEGRVVCTDPPAR
jgi:hypothetical protein